MRVTEKKLAANGADEDICRPHKVSFGADEDIYVADIHVADICRPHARTASPTASTPASCTLS